MNTHKLISPIVAVVAILVALTIRPVNVFAQEENSKIQYYGEQITTNGVVSKIDLASFMEDKDSADVKLEGTILKTCEKKGCWMTVDLGNDREMRVTFKDYGFFVPKEGAEGKKTIVEGTIKRKVTDVETLKHFAEDAGKSQEEIDAISDPKEELTFVATGVIIKD